MTFTLVLLHCCPTNSVILTCLVVITKSVHYQLHAILQISRRLNDQESCLCASISSGPFFFLEGVPSAHKILSARTSTCFQLEVTLYMCHFVDVNSLLQYSVKRKDEWSHEREALFPPLWKQV